MYKRDVRERWHAWMEAMRGTPRVWMRSEWKSRVSVPMQAVDARCRRHRGSRSTSTPKTRFDTNCTLLARRQSMPAALVHRQKTAAVPANGLKERLRRKVEGNKVQRVAHGKHRNAHRPKQGSTLSRHVREPDQHLQIVLRVHANTARQRKNL